MSKGEKPLRWGIVSVGRISIDYVLALKLQPSTEHEVTAVAARSLQRSQEFAKKYSIPHAYGSYEELSTDANIDVVYIGAINSEHHRLCLMMLNAGKHVVCEKPVTLNSKQLQQVLKLAKEKELFFLEGIWTRFFPATDRIRQEVADGNIGDVKYVRAEFGVPVGTAERLRKLELGGGAAMDLGIYPIQLAVMLLGRKPEKIIASGTLFPEGADESESILLIYKDGKKANLTTSTSYSLPNGALIGGTKGTLEIPTWHHCPDTLVTKKGTIVFPLPSRPEGMMFHNSEGFVYEQKAVREAILQGHTETKQVPWADSEAIMAILDEVRRQLGVVYKEDGE